MGIYDQVNLTKFLQIIRWTSNTFSRGLSFYRLSLLFLVNQLFCTHDQIFEWHALGALVHAFIVPICSRIRLVRNVHHLKWTTQLEFNQSFSCQNSMTFKLWIWSTSVYNRPYWTERFGFTGLRWVLWSQYREKLGVVGKFGCKRERAKRIYP